MNVIFIYKIDKYFGTTKYKEFHIIFGAEGV